MTPDELVGAAKASGLDGICLTEHNRQWDREQIEILRGKFDFPVFAGMEVTTKDGDILVFGLHRNIDDVLTAAELRELAADHGAYMIAAHPFRGFLMFGFSQLSLTPERAAERPIFQAVDAIEAYNCKVSAQETEIAFEVATRIGLPCVAGSDAHIVLYTQNGQALRIESTTVNPQQTGSASGVAGIKLRKDDQLLGATVVPNGKDDKNWQVIVISENGYVHRFPLAGITVKGRATMGVRCLRITKASGKLAAAVVGLEKNNVDIYLADWRRQRIPIASMAPASRDVQGDRLVRDSKKVPVVQAVVL